MLSQRIMLLLVMIGTLRRLDGSRSSLGHLWSHLQQTVKQGNQKCYYVDEAYETVSKLCPTSWRSAAAFLLAPSS